MPEKGEEPGRSRYCRVPDWDSVVVGMAAAFGSGSILSVPVFCLAEALPGYSLRAGGALECALPLAAAFLAFLYGGYAAGRRAGQHGVGHGILVPVATLLVTVTLAIFALAAEFGLELACSLLWALVTGASRNDLRGPEEMLPEVGIPPAFILALSLLISLGGALGGGLGLRHRGR